MILLKNSNYSTYYKCIEILHSAWWKKFRDIDADADASCVSFLS